IADHDLLLSSGEQPGVLVRTLKRATDTDALIRVRERLDAILARYLEASLPIDFVAQVATAVTDQITRRAIQLAIEGLGAPPVPFACLALGSQGRGEQVLRTDQDNALVFEDGSYQDYFLQLGTDVVDRLEMVGFERCPAEMMASNPKWCGTLNHWRQVFSRWIETPEPRSLLHANIFFDFRCVYGSTENTEALREHVFGSVEREGLFLPALANGALHNPAPLSFFRGFVVERNGEHRNEFDLKARAMMPLADAARVLSLELGIREVNTIDRFRAAAKADESLSETCRGAAAAYSVLMEIRTHEGKRRGDSGRYVDIQSAGAFDRQRLRQAFSALNRVQQMLTVRYQTDLLR
ncbi:MAG: DUF294 nucleotidyltransferase-like domain-containing protein, partial [Myxococcota bacterium]